MPQVSGLLWDAIGQPYRIGTDGQKQYMSPMSVAAWAMPGGESGPTGDPRAAAWATAHGATIGTGGQVSNAAAPGAGLLSTAGAWNPQTGQFDQGTNWNNILDLVVGGGLGVGGASALGAFGGASGAAGGAAAPTATGANLGVDAAGVGASSGISTGAGIGTDVGLPSATGAAISQVPGMGQPGSPGYAPGDITSASQLAGGVGSASALMKAIAGLGGVVAGHALGGDGSGNVPASLTSLLDLANRRAQSQTPLFNAVNSGLYQMMPTFAKTGQMPGGGTNG